MKINLWHTYHLVCIAENDHGKLHSGPVTGPLNGLKMLFSLTNALAAFQHFINKVFANPELHIQQVFQCLCTHRLLCTSWEMLLPHQRSRMPWISIPSERPYHGLNPAKVKDNQSFLGFANIPEIYSDIVVVLPQLMQNSVTQKFSTDCLKAFETLKDVFTTTLTLANSDLKNLETSPTQ